MRRDLLGLALVALVACLLGAWLVPGCEAVAQEPPAPAPLTAPPGSDPSMQLLFQLVELQRKAQATPAGAGVVEVGGASLGSALLAAVSTLVLVRRFGDVLGLASPAAAATPPVPVRDLDLAQALGRLGAQMEGLQTQLANVTDEQGPLRQLKHDIPNMLQPIQTGLAVMAERYESLCERIESLEGERPRVRG